MACVSRVTGGSVAQRVIPPRLTPQPTGSARHRSPLLHAREDSRHSATSHLESAITRTLDTACAVPTAPDRAPHDGRICLTGGSIAYTLAGHGPALLLIHGLGGSRKTWRHMIEVLSQTHTVIAPDLPGHGDSDPPAGDYSLGAHACALRDLMMSLGYRRFSIAGHSLGGGVALQTAYQFPERIDRLLLISSGGLGPEISYALRAATLPGADSVVAALSVLPSAVTRRAMKMVPGLASRSDAAQIADVLTELRDDRKRTAFIRTARSVIDWRGQAVSAERQTGLLNGVPVLIAWGDADTTIPPTHHRVFATRIPGAASIEIAGAGHFPHETDSTQLLGPMLTFLSSTLPFAYSESSWVQLLTRHDDCV